MELETRGSVGVVQEKERVRASTIVIALLMVVLSVVVALLVCMPDLWQQFMMVKWEVFKGALIGISALPVFLFVTIKGGKEWYKKWWVWVSIGVVLIAIVTIVLVKGNNITEGGAGMGTPSMNDPYGNMNGGNVMMMP